MLQYHKKLSTEREEHLWRIIYGGEFWKSYEKHLGWRALVMPKNIYGGEF